MEWQASLLRKMPDLHTAKELLLFSIHFQVHVKGGKRNIALNVNSVTDSQWFFAHWACASQDSEQSKSMSKALAALEAVFIFLRTCNQISSEASPYNAEQGGSRLMLPSAPSARLKELMCFRPHYTTESFIVTDAALWLQAHLAWQSPVGFKTPCG